MRLTCAHKTGRVRVPPPICSTHCSHPFSWNKPWVTSEEHLSSLSCVLIWTNWTISRVSGITTVGWRAKLKPHDAYQVYIQYQLYSTVVVQWSHIAQWSQHWWLKLEAMHGFNFWWLVAFHFSILPYNIKNEAIHGFNFWWLPSFSFSSMSLN